MSNAIKQTVCESYCCSFAHLVDRALHELVDRPLLPVVAQKIISRSRHRLREFFGVPLIADLPRARAPREDRLASFRAARKLHVVTVLLVWALGCPNVGHAAENGGAALLCNTGVPEHMAPCAYSDSTRAHLGPT